MCSSLHHHVVGLFVVFVYLLFVCFRFRFVVAAAAPLLMLPARRPIFVQHLLPATSTDANSVTREYARRQQRRMHVLIALLHPAQIAMHHHWELHPMSETDEIYHSSAWV